MSAWLQLRNYSHPLSSASYVSKIEKIFTIQKYDVGVG